jgi:hypothetical protein
LDLAAIDAALARLESSVFTQLDGDPSVDERRHDLEHLATEHVGWLFENYAGLDETRVARMTEQITGAA